MCRPECSGALLSSRLPARSPPEDQNPHLFDQIWEEERAGVLNHVLSGLLRLVERNYKFAEPQDCIKARQAFFTESNPLCAFLTERCEKVPTAKTRLTYIREAFREWAKENSVASFSLGSHKLKSHLELLGFEVKRINGNNTVYGLVFKVEGRSDEHCYQLPPTATAGTGIHLQTVPAVLLSDRKLSQM